MLGLGWTENIRSVFCSTEKKAIDGAVILAGKLDLQYAECASLGENDRSSTGFLPPAEFENVADQFFSEPAMSVRGWETAVDAQRRIVAAVRDITSSGTVQFPAAIVSHGAVGTLLLCHLNGWSIDRRHDQPGSGGGNYFCFHADTGVVEHGWSAIDAAEE